MSLRLQIQKYISQGTTEDGIEWCGTAWHDMTLMTLHGMRSDEMNSTKILHEENLDQGSRRQPSAKGTPACDSLAGVEQYYPSQSCPESCKMWLQKQNWVRESSPKVPRKLLCNAAFDAPQMTWHSMTRQCMCTCRQVHTHTTHGQMAKQHSSLV